MNTNARQQKGEILVQLAEMYGEELTVSRLKLYLETLADLSLSEFKRAGEMVLKDTSVNRMPLPAKLISYIGKPVGKQLAISRINKITLAIRKFGYIDPKGAEKFISDPVIWGFVNTRGGWKHVCTDGANNLNDPIIYAQMRDGLESFETEHRCRNIQIQSKISNLIQQGLKK